MSCEGTESLSESGTHGIPAVTHRGGATLNMKEFRIKKNEAGQRFDKYLVKLLPGAPKSFLYRMLRKKNIVLNGGKAHGPEIVREGDFVRLFLADETFKKFSGQPNSETTFSPENERILASAKHVFESPVYADEEIMLINKPRGILSQKAGADDVSLNECLIRFWMESEAGAGEDIQTFRPAVMNRLDRNTTGIVLCGLSLPGEQFLAEILRERSAKKLYRTLVFGCPEDGVFAAWHRPSGKDGLVKISDEPVGGASPIRTGIRTIECRDGMAYLEIDLLTGKKHQIRAHLAHLGFPVAGDEKYGSREKNRELRKRFGLRSQFLHAYGFSFPEKIEGRFAYLAGRCFTAPLPEFFGSILRELGFAREVK